MHDIPRTPPLLTCKDPTRAIPDPLKRLMKEKFRALDYSTKPHFRAGPAADALLRHCIDMDTQTFSDFLQAKLPHAGRYLTNVLHCLSHDRYEACMRLAQEGGHPFK